MLPNAYSTPSILLVALLFVHEMLSLVVCNVVCVWQWFDVNVRNNRSDGMLRQSQSVVLFTHSRCINSFIYQLRKKKALNEAHVRFECIASTEESSLNQFSRSRSLTDFHESDKWMHEVSAIEFISGVRWKCNWTGKFEWTNLITILTKFVRLTIV